MFLRVSFKEAGTGSLGKESYSNSKTLQQEAAQRLCSAEPAGSSEEKLHTHATEFVEMLVALKGKERTEKQNI